ncbi:MAG: pilus assembly protein HicB [Duncaniella sp.]|nr:pilus assembly protein HicB [Duncaniella sp.]
MIANIVVEQTKEGDFSCFIEEDIPYLGLLGYGRSSEEAINSLIDFYNQSKEELRAEGKIVPELKFIIHYDMPSFFNRFNFLNQSKIAEKAGINPSLMRKYTSGVARAGQKQYNKLHAAVQTLATEMLAAAF